MGESFREFLDSFSYGSRSDLSFKFLKRLTDDEGAEFFQQVLTEIGELFDGAPPDGLVDLVYQWQVRAYAPPLASDRPYVYDDRPFTPLSRRLSELTLGLVTSSGHFTLHEPPGDGRGGKTQTEVVAGIADFLRGSPELSVIPTDVTTQELAVRHPGYDTRSSSRDPEVALPVQALLRAEARNDIAALAAAAYSFVGAASQLRLKADKDGWVKIWKAAGIEALFLVPV